MTGMTFLGMKNVATKISVVTAQLSTKLQRSARQAPSQVRNIETEKGRPMMPRDSDFGAQRQKSDSEPEDPSP